MAFPSMGNAKDDAEMDAMIAEERRLEKICMTLRVRLHPGNRAQLREQPAVGGVTTRICRTTKRQEIG